MALTGINLREVSLQLTRPHLSAEPLQRLLHSTACNGTDKPAWSAPAVPRCGHEGSDGPAGAADQHARGAMLQTWVQRLSPASACAPWLASTAPLRPSCRHAAPPSTASAGAAGRRPQNLPLQPPSLSAAARGDAAEVLRGHGSARCWRHGRAPQWRHMRGHCRAIAQVQMALARGMRISATGCELEGPACLGKQGKRASVGHGMQSLHQARLHAASSRLESRGQHVRCTAPLPAPPSRC